MNAITVAEIRLEIALLPDGKRRANLARLADAMFQEDFAGIEGLRLINPWLAA